MFGRPRVAEVWNTLGKETGAEVIDRGFFKGKKVQLHVKPWTITLDTHTVHTQHSHTTYTRIRVPFVNPEGFRFSIRRASVFSGVFEMLGFRDIQVGDPEFDAAMVVKSNHEPRVQQLLLHPEIRRILLAQPRIRLAVKDDEGWFGPAFPPGVDELHFQAMGHIRDAARLKELFQLFTLILEELCRAGSATRQDPGVAL